MTTTAVPISTIGRPRHTPTMTAPSFSPELSPFRPISPVSLEDPNALFPVRIKNLPRDLTPREFHLIFTFAKDYVKSELIPLPADEPAASAVGIVYFRGYGSARDAHDTLIARSDIFDLHKGSKHGSAANGATSSSAVGSPLSGGPLICEFLAKPVFDQPFNFASTGKPPFAALSGGPLSSSPSNPHPINGSIQNQSTTNPAGVPGPPGAAKPSSKFNFSQNQFETGLPGPAIDLSQKAGHPTDFYPDVFSPSSPRGSFPDAVGAQIGSMGAPPPGAAPGAPGFPRVTGKSVLLESAGRDDEEYEDMVKDPVAWLSRAGTGSVKGPVGSTAGMMSPGQSLGTGITTAGPPPSAPGQQWPMPSEKGRRPNGSAPGSTTRAFSSLSIGGKGVPTQPANGALNNGQGGSPNGNGAGAQNAVGGPGGPFSPSNNATTLQALQNGGRVLPPANPADQNPPCNTLYVGNLPMNTSEDELKALFSRQRGYKRLCFRTKMNGPMCFVEFEDVAYATRALNELYGRGLSNSVKGGIRLSFSKNPLGVRSNTSHNNNNNNSNNNNSNSNSSGNGNGNGNNGSISNGVMGGNNMVNSVSGNGSMNTNGNIGGGPGNFNGNAGSSTVDRKGSLSHGGGASIPGFLVGK
ncbi:uncharacterized protein V1510DRAFT_217841 [Dipodascopsis tothii]|uniref:uncharacterized protein n=1 Tax=Dipodascopsis tothii TaxID=44089 RepID=UPI0034CF59E4